MFRLRLLPWEYGVRNLLRRPSRSALTLAALAVVVLLIFVVVGFIRGLEQSLAVSGDADVVLVYSMNAEANIENSAIAAQVPGLLAANLTGIQKRFDKTYLSPELYLGTRIKVNEQQGLLGLVRGVTSAAALVRRQVRSWRAVWPPPSWASIHGNWPSGSRFSLKDAPGPSAGNSPPAARRLNLNYGAACQIYSRC
jgi:putative ABC transport system permease protein